MYSSDTVMKTFTGMMSDKRINPSMLTLESAFRLPGTTRDLQRRRSAGGSSLKPLQRPPPDHHDVAAAGCRHWYGQR